MWMDAIREGGPIMYAVLAAWLVVLAGVLDRLLYAVGRALRAPGRRAARLLARGEREQARRLLVEERARAERGISRIDGVSQLATSIGLFGTVVGIAQGFLARGGASDPAASLAALSDGLSTALFTTIAGLFVFLFGQLAMVMFREWLELSEREALALLGHAEALEVNR